MDASDTVVGAVLSQRSDKDNKLHPCAFSSSQLSPAERNYNIGNQELLAVKLAFKEWRHWLEGAKQPNSKAVILTNHKNLEYLQMAKRLDSCQATLSQQHDPVEEDETPQLILPASARLAARLDIEFINSLENVPAPSACPDGRFYVPEPLRPKVLQWCHSNKLSCHPGIARTKFVLQQCFWWWRLCLPHDIVSDQGP